MHKTAPSKFGVIAIASTLLVIILISGLALFSFLVRPEEPEPVEVLENPTFAVRLEDVDPALSIALLGGISAQDVIDQAASKARPGTALATIIYSPELGAKNAAGDLLLLADSFTKRDRVTQAKVSYQMAGTLATLSPDLPDTLRIDIFLQAGIGLTKLQDPILAKLFLDQAFLVATESNFIQAAYRRPVLEQLELAYRAISLPEAARKSQEAAMEPGELQALPESPLVLPIGKDISLPAEVQQAESARWRAAQKVVKELVELGGAANPESVDALRQALIKEDELKTQFYASAIESEPQLSGKVNLIQAKINWQSIKFRVARQGFGLNLAPEWEAQVEQIRAALTTSYEELYRLYGDIIVAMPDASQIDRATEEALRRQILAGQLGQYPNYPSEQLKAQLLTATARLVETQPGTKLRVSYLSIDGVNYYTLISDAEILNQ